MKRQLDTPIAAEALRAAAVLDDHAGPWPRPEATRVITVSNQKGGVGKTTSVVNIAAALAMHGLRVVVVDLDPQGNASTALGVEHSAGTPSTYEVLLSGRPLRDILVTVPSVAGELRCAPATIDLAGAELELASQVAREYRLQRAVDELLKQDDPPDYVLIDSPPSLGLLTVNALVAAREVLIPIQCEYYALEGLAQLLGTIEMVQSYLNKTLRITTVLLTMYDSRTRLADQVAADVRNHFTGLVVEAVIPRNVRVSEAPGYGQTVMTYDPGSRGAISYSASRVRARWAHSGGSVMSTRHGAPGGLGRGLSALIRTSPRPEEAELIGDSAWTPLLPRVRTRGVILDSERYA